MTFYFRYEKARMERQRIADASKGVGRPKVGGKFELVDQEGRPFVSDEKMKGRFSLVSAILYMWDVMDGGNTQPVEKRSSVRRETKAPCAWAGGCKSVVPATSCTPMDVQLIRPSMLLGLLWIYALSRHLP